MQLQPEEQRYAVRFDVGLPLRLPDGSPGRTCNVSRDGVAFDTPAPQKVGALVNFTLEYRLQGAPQRLLCEGKVLRVEDHGAYRRVAVRLLDPFFAGEAGA